jgi:hypothetical protein
MMIRTKNTNNLVGTQDSREYGAIPNGGFMFGLNLINHNNQSNDPKELQVLFGKSNI